MGLSTGFGVNQKTEPAPAPAPPFALTSAANGLSVDPVSRKIVLGNNATLTTAQLLSNREIPFNGFDFSFVGVDYQGTPHRIKFNDNSIELIGENDEGSGTFLRFTDLNSGIVGSLSNSGAGLALTTDGTLIMQAVGVSSNIYIGAGGDANGALHINLSPALTGSDISQAIVSSQFNTAAGNPTMMKFSLNDLLSGSDAAFLEFEKGGVAQLIIDKNGNLRRDGSISFLSAAGTNETLMIDPSTITARIGDINGISGGMQMFVDSSQQQIRIGDVNVLGNGTTIILDDTAESINLIIGTTQALEAKTTGVTVYTDFTINDGTNNVLQTDVGNLSVAMGDINGAGASVTLEVDGFGGNINVNGIPGFSGTVAAPATITVVNGIVTNVA